MNFIEGPISRVILVDPLESLEGCLIPEIMQVIAGTVPKKIVLSTKINYG